jgi:hypothetical protein
LENLSAIKGTSRSPLKLEHRRAVRRTHAEQHRLAAEAAREAGPDLARYVVGSRRLDEM